MRQDFLVATLAATPSFGPAIVTLFGLDIPVLSLCLSSAGLMLARLIGPPPTRKLTRVQECAVTAVLLMILFLAVTGEMFPDGEPLGVGMAVAWGVGLGMSGLLVLEFLGDRVLAAFKALMGVKHRDDGPGTGV